MLHGYIPQLIDGLCVTLQLTFFSLIVGVALALVWFLLGNIKFKPIKYLVLGFTSLIRSLPELMVLFIIYFSGAIVLSKLFNHYIDISNFIAALAALSLIFSCYFSQVLKSSYEAIDKNQLLAAKAYAMTSWQVLHRITFPLMLKHIMPGFSNLCLVLLKDTAIVSLIGTVDLMQVAHLASSATAKPFTFYLVVAIVYLLLTSGFNVVLNYINKKWVL